MALNVLSLRRKQNGGLQIPQRAGAGTSMEVEGSRQNSSSPCDGRSKDLTADHVDRHPSRYSPPLLSYFVHVAPSPRAGMIVCSRASIWVHAAPFRLLSGQVARVIRGSRRLCHYIPTSRYRICQTPQRCAPATLYDHIKRNPRMQKSSRRKNIPTPSPSQAGPLTALYRMALLLRP